VTWDFIGKIGGISFFVYMSIHLVLGFVYGDEFERKCEKISGVTVRYNISTPVCVKKDAIIDLK